MSGEIHSHSSCLVELLESKNKSIEEQVAATKTFTKKCVAIT